MQKWPAKHRRNAKSAKSATDTTSAKHCISPAFKSLLHKAVA